MLLFFYSWFMVIFKRGIVILIGLVTLTEADTSSLALSFIEYLIFPIHLIIYSLFPLVIKLCANASDTL